jgi:predicted MFS family arabinose efflux permease
MSVWAMGVPAGFHRCHSPPGSSPTFYPPAAGDQTRPSTTPTNVSLILASCFGYSFLSGLRTFALIFARGRFGIGTGMATILFLAIGLAAVAGTLVSGRWTDRFIGRGIVDARLVVGGAGFLVASVVSCRLFPSDEACALLLATLCGPRSRDGNRTAGFIAARNTSPPERDAVYEESQFHQSEAMADSVAG